DRGHRNLRRLGAENLDIVIGHKQGHSFRISGDGGDDGSRVEGGDGSGSGASAHAPGVKAHPENGREKDGERDKKVAWNHVSSITAPPAVEREWRRFHSPGRRQSVAGRRERREQRRQKRAVRLRPRWRRWQCYLGDGA